MCFIAENLSAQCFYLHSVHMQSCDFCVTGPLMGEDSASSKVYNMAMENGLYQNETTQLRNQSKEKSCFTLMFDELADWKF